MTADEKKILAEKRKKNIWKNLPSELTHIICFSSTTVDIMNLAICDKFLNSQINTNTFWRSHFITNYNGKFNKNNEGQWKELYIQKYIEMNSIKDKLLWVISKEYYRLIPDVLQLKKFLLTLEYDPIVYLQEVIYKPNAVKMLRILFDHNWDLQEYKDQLL